MSDWTTIPADTFETDRPVLGSTHLAIVENFSALAEGAAGAPRVQGVALDNVYLGNLFRRNTTAGIGFNDLDNCRGLFFTGYSRSASGGEIRIRYSSDNGSTFGAWQNIAGFNFAALTNIHIDLVTGSAFTFVIDKLATGTDVNNHVQSTSVSTTVPAGVNAFQLGVGSSSTLFGFQLDVFAIGGKA